MYLDDITLFGRTEAGMSNRLKNIFEKLQLVTSKCHFFKDKVYYLGQDISNSSRQYMYVVTEAVQDLRYLLGFASYYRRFVKGFSHIA